MLGLAGLGLAELELGLPRFVSRRFYAVFAWSGSAQLGFAELGLSRLGWPLLGSARPGLGWLDFVRALLSLLPAPVISKHKQHCGGTRLACTFDMSSGTDF